MAMPISLTPLPDTADELCTVAKQLQLSPDDILLGANATETAIKTLSEQGKLAQYRVLHFATHGTLAGEISGTAAGESLGTLGAAVLGGGGPQARCRLGDAVGLQHRCRRCRACGRSPAWHAPSCMRVPERCLSRTGR